MVTATRSCHLIPRRRPAEPPGDERRQFLLRERVVHPEDAQLDAAEALLSQVPGLPQTEVVGARGSTPVTELELESGPAYSTYFKQIAKAVELPRP